MRKHVLPWSVATILGFVVYQQLDNLTGLPGAPALPGQFESLTAAYPNYGPCQNGGQCQFSHQCLQDPATGTCNDAESPCTSSPGESQNPKYGQPHSFCQNQTQDECMQTVMPCVVIEKKCVSKLTGCECEEGSIMEPIGTNYVCFIMLP